MSQFGISETNPNEEVGGGGCLGVGDAKSEDCQGPYVVFFHASTDSNISPHAVLCARHLREATEALARDIPGEIDLPEDEVTEDPEPDSIPDV